MASKEKLLASVIVANSSNGFDAVASSAAEPTKRRWIRGSNSASLALVCCDGSSLRELSMKSVLHFSRLKPETSPDATKGA